MATKVTLGGKEFLVPELNFAALERCWPSINEAMWQADPIRSANCGLTIIAAGLMEADDFDAEKYGGNNGRSEEDTLADIQRFLRKTMKAKDLASLGSYVNEIVKEAGVIDENPPKVAAEATEEENPLTVIAQELLPSLSQPDAKVGAGTA
jgi:hypothetical protein